MELFVVIYLVQLFNFIATFFVSQLPTVSHSPTVGASQYAVQYIKMLATVYLALEWLFYDP